MDHRCTQDVRGREISHLDLTDANAGSVLNGHHILGDAFNLTLAVERQLAVALAGLVHDLEGIA